MKTILTLLVATCLLSACSNSTQAAQDTNASTNSVAEAKPTSAAAATFEQDPEASSLAKCAHAALASGNTSAWDDLMASLRDRHKAMLPESDKSQQESDVIRAVFLGKKSLDEKGIKDNEQLGQWLNQECF